MSLGAAVLLLQTALSLLTLVQANPAVPVVNREYAIQVAQQAIAQANLALSAQSTGGATCGNGNDYYDGGDGEDTLTYSGKRSDFTISQNANGTYTFRDNVPCRAETDTVVNVERFLFADGLYTLQTLHPDSVSTAAVTANATVPVPTIFYFSADKTTVSQGESLTLSWSSTAGNCSIVKEESWGQSTVAASVGSATTYTLYPTATGTYTLQCFNPVGEKTGPIASKYVSIYVNPNLAPSCTMNVSGYTPSPYSYGAGYIYVAPHSAATISWTSQNADYAVYQGDKAEANGSRTYYDLTNTANTYEAIFYGKGGSTYCTKTVYVDYKG